MNHNGQQKNPAGEEAAPASQFGSAELVALHHRNTVLEEEVLQHGKAIAEFQSENERLRTALETVRERLDILEDVLAPRLLTILTLKPFRFILNERRRKKQYASIQHAQEIAAGAADKAPVQDDEFPPSVDASRKKRPSIYDDYQIYKPLGIAVFVYDREQNLAAILESLSLQGQIAETTVFIDGDQGRLHVRAALDKVEETARRFGVTRIRRNRGNFGFRKMIILAMREMMSDYERILFLEDDCFPTGAAIKGFSKELDAIEADPRIFSAYGHPFGVEHAGENFGRFQGWGWATTTAKLRPIWEQLLKCYLMSETEYLEFVDSALTPDVRARIDVTPGRQPTSTLNKFFAWDETVCLLTGVAGMTHRPSAERIIYNFGAGDTATHFRNVEWFRRAPFNMIARDEVWDHF